MKPDPTVCLSIFIVCALWRVIDQSSECGGSEANVSRVTIREDSFSVQSSGRGPASVNTYVHIDSVLSRSPVVGHRVWIFFVSHARPSPRSGFGSAGEQFHHHKAALQQELILVIYTVRV